MSRLSIATPCPAPYTHSTLPVPSANRRTSTFSTLSEENATEEIDYTRALHVGNGIQHKPRRKSTFAPKLGRGAEVTIFEDVFEDQELVVESQPKIGGSTLLGKRAQRIPGRGILKGTDGNGSGREVERRRPGVVVQPTIAECGGQNQDENVGEVVAERRPATGLTKDPRRRTIFVPSDDTSVMTIHPGANTTDRLNDTFQLPNLDVGPASTMAASPKFERSTITQPNKRPRMSLAAAPKRIPLQQVASPESNVPGVDVAGQNGGKENIPPNAREHVRQDKKPAITAVTFEKSTKSGSSIFEQTAASKARQSIVHRNAVPFSKPSVHVARRQSTMAEKSESAPSMAQAKPRRLSMMPRQDVRHQASPSSDDSTSRPHKTRPLLAERKVARLQQYPVLSEDLAQPELYEDSWLGHQEVALTELINQIFARATPTREPWQWPGKGLREELIKIYHQPNVATLHKRLQASLLYGALSRPRDGTRPPNPALDIGLRKRFLNLWLETYDLETLRTASEVVFGRQLPRKHFSTSGATEGILDPHKNRRSLISFLETFLVEVDDAEDPDEDRGDDVHGKWRKMIQRSLMLIWLLDQAKTSGVVHGRLFKATSARKCSVAVLNALVSMLVPSIGDVVRVLRHLDYEVSHVQDPLDEVKYHIENLAVDLRDGVMLARLVEVLLFAPSSTVGRSFESDATVTVQLPDLTILESALHDTEGVQCPRILSQHLKMPCIGRAQKVFNVEVAISALHDHGRLGFNGMDVTAEDIVDGHREKTLGLLWSLVSTRGLEQLVDFKELAADIKRRTNNAIDLETLPTDFTRLSQPQQESLLKRWASTHCARKGLRISNLTTSFADGKAYASILDAFTDYIPLKVSLDITSPISDRQRLTSQLQASGCSKAFIKQLGSANGTIPSRNTTISSLAFLASRLLPLARQHNASITIQRAFRLRCARTQMSQCVVLARLAHACATIVQTQNRLIDAATVLQRSWRLVLDSRVGRLNKDAEVFQAIAKGWLSRRRVKQKRSRAGVDSQTSGFAVGW